MTEQNKTVDVEIDIPDEVFLALAKIAHEQGITFNELCVNILRDYINGKLTIDRNQVLEENLVSAAKNVVTDGVTQQTLKEFGYSFTEWCTEYTGEKLCTELIQEGFDDADKSIVVL